ncbi:MAG: beta-lactamase family protein [Planctomycetes bacterium]|nr:beta-lactamase family protein [Planctomycetota bacterium]
MVRLRRVLSAFTLAGIVLAAFPRAEEGIQKDPARGKAKGEAVVSGKSGEELDAVIGGLDEPGGFSGCVLVAKGGKVLLEKGYGVLDASKGTPMPKDALWDWASACKQFTAAAVLKLEMQKKLSLEDPLGKHFRSAPADKKGITIRQLLNHTAGIGYPDTKSKGWNPFDRDAAVQCILEAPLTHAPGKRWAYSNAGYWLAAALVEKASGKPFESYLREHLFEPAGMKGAGSIGDAEIDLARVPLEDRGKSPRFVYGPSLSWGYRGSGGMLASTREMLAWHQALQGEKVLSKAAKEKYYDSGLQNYALGWVVKVPGRQVQHGGNVGHIATWYFRDLENDVVVAFACNQELKTDRETLCQRLWTIARNARD